MGGMPKKLNFTLTTEQVAQVENAMRQDKRAEVRPRATGVHLLHLGYEAKEVATMLKVTVQALYQWYHHFIAHGIAGLANQPRGRPKAKADAHYLQVLEETLAQEPREFGYDFAIWTVERLRDHLAQVTGVHLSVSRLRMLLRQQRYVYRRPKHDLTSLQDQDAKVAAQVQLAEVKKAQGQTLSSSSLWTKQA